MGHFRIPAAVVLLTAMGIAAAEAGPRGGGPPGWAGGPGFAGGMPPGFSQGNRTGFVNGLPPGWSRGKKVGWGCKPGTRGCVPPGLRNR
ncbi:MAG TPA: hypothetical protein VNK48_14010 [Xanthobacteraceae bacterium]|jgi:hypothetical protein|nr:hypothetical protein [Xanthobacteraceae bacterium]